MLYIMFFSPKCKVFYCITPVLLECILYALEKNPSSVVVASYNTHYQITSCHNQEDYNINLHHCENVRSYIYKAILHDLVQNS
jgi:hypothetical protein